MLCKRAWPLCFRFLCLCGTFDIRIWNGEILDILANLSKGSFEEHWFLRKVARVWLSWQLICAEHLLVKDLMTLQLALECNGKEAFLIAVWLSGEEKNRLKVSLFEILKLEHYLFVVEWKFRIGGCIAWLLKNFWKLGVRIWCLDRQTFTKGGRSKHVRFE